MSRQLCCRDLFAGFRGRFPIDGLVAVCPDRSGGISSAPYASLNLGFSTGDRPEAVLENRRRLAEAIGVPLDSWVVPGQVHGSRVLRVDRTLAGEGALEPSKTLTGNDALIAVEEGIFLLALSADCPLVVVADPRLRIVAVAHSGWRGMAAGVIGELLTALDACGSRPRERIAALAPAICGDCYEVGDEVRAALAGQPGAEEAGRGSGVDLRVMADAALVGSGIDSDRIAWDDRCSYEDPHLFSHRRDLGRTGRGGVLVGWRH
ncbi:MAG TPA: laccase domain-containing protein [Planctomycetes bacterium]|nr:laccase domain-containing protein [Planctomycetota bacterium]HIN79909.1 laccase domain-containing protein [Planctomycetota bacterium]